MKWVILINEDTIQRVSKLLDILGNPTRLKILLLIGETKRPLHIKAVARTLKMDYAAVYRHVKILEESGLLEVYEVGRSRVLILKNAETVNQIIEIANKAIQ